MKILAALLLAVALAAPSTAPAQSASPDMNAFVAAFNAENAGALTQFLKSNIAAPPGDIGGDPVTAADLVSMREAVGPVTLAGVSDGPQATAVTVRAKSGWYDFSFEKAQGGTRPQPFVDLSTGLGLPPRKSGESLQHYLQGIAQAGYFSGQVLEVSGDAAPVEGAYGLANRTSKARVTRETIFNIASLGKLLTSAAVAQLIEAGKLHPGDTIGQWLPDYPNDAAKAATVQQLLDFQSGIGDIFTRKFVSGGHSRIRELADYLPFFAADPLLFAPGKGQAYSNGGYVVLGLIVEKASGENFYSYMHRHIFAPAGMTHTSYPTLDEMAPDRAIGYTRRTRGFSTWSTPLRDATSTEPGRGSSAGGAYSTAEDLYKFVRAVRNGTLVKGTYPWNGTGGWLGGTPGWNAALLVRKTGVTIVLTNQDPPIGRTVAAMIANAP